MTYNEQTIQAWVDFLGDLEGRYGHFEWFGHFTFAEPLHPEQASKRWNRWLVPVNRELYGRRYGKHGQGALWVRAQENQRREAIHYHAFLGNGVSRLRRLSWMDKWTEIAGGYCRIWPYDGEQGAKEYITKYQLKEGEIELYVPPSLLGPKLN